MLSEIQKSCSQVTFGAKAYKHLPVTTINMKKNLIIIGSVIVILVIVSLFIFLPEASNKCNKNLPFDEYNLCLYNTAVSENNVGICNEANTNGAKYTCITDFAKEKEDLTVCDSLPDFDKQSCIMGIAVKTKNLNLCKTLQSSDYQISCENQIHSASAIESGSEQDCENIEGQVQKDRCYAGVAINKGDAQICGKIIIAYSTSCYMQIAKSKGDSQICSNINNEPDRELCLNQFNN